MPVEDAFFDVVLCTEVLEHLPDPIKALAELSRVLKKGGQLILTAPFCSLTHFSPYHYSTGFNRYFYSHHLNSLGFNIVEITPNGNFFEFLAQELNRLASVAEQYSSLKPDIELEYSQSVLTQYLEKMSASDAGSHELLCFGYNVMAVKAH